MQNKGDSSAFTHVHMESEFGQAAQVVPVAVAGAAALVVAAAAAVVHVPMAIALVGMLGSGFPFPCLAAAVASCLANIAVASNATRP